jgi:hypothetical protein
VCVKGTRIGGSRSWINVAYELSDSDREQLRHLLQLDHSWDKIILVSSLDATQSYEL